MRRIKQGQGPQSITVWLASGTYRQTQAVVFGLEDSAADGEQTTYAALPGQTPVISGGWRGGDAEHTTLPVPGD